MSSRGTWHDPRMAVRPSDTWRRDVEEEAAEVAAGRVRADKAYAAELWSQWMIERTDSALVEFERELPTIDQRSDEAIWDLVRRLVLTLNEIDEVEVSRGGGGYETGEREDLCEYIDLSLTEAGVDLDGLAARQNIDRSEITDKWRMW